MKSKTINLNLLFYIVVLVALALALSCAAYRAGQASSAKKQEAVIWRYYDQQADVVCWLWLPNAESCLPRSATNLTVEYLLSSDQQPPSY
jgi:hypothetical protein